jgi:hypothetical protein
MVQTIRKQTLIMLEARGYGRTHELFKEVFGMTTRGVYFALVSCKVLRGGAVRLGATARPGE